MKDKKNKGWRMTNNIFVDVVDKHATPAIGFWTDSSDYDASQNITCDHNLYWRKRCEKMSLFGFITGDRVQAKTVADLQKRFGFGLHSRFGDPMFADPRRGDFRLKPGSPALGMGVNGKDVGMDVSVMSGAGRRSN